MTKIAVVDIETTGPHPNEGDQIIQIAAVIVDNQQVVAQYNMKLNPLTAIPAHIQRLTGIKDEDVISAPTFAQVASLWYARLKDCIFVAHNLAFDLNFLKYQFELHMNLEFNPIAIDTVTLSKIVFPQAPGFNLTELSQYFGLTFKQAHDALADSRMTTFLLDRIAQKLNQLTDQQKAILSTLFEKLSYQELYLLKHLETFEMNLSKLEMRQVKQDNQPKLNFSESVLQQIEWVFEQKQNDKVWLTHYQGDLPYAQKVAYVHYLRQLGHRIVIVVKHDKEADNFTANLNTLEPACAIRFRRRQQIFEPAYFAELWGLLDQNHYNQHELIHLGAYFIWQLDTQAGYLDELNSELDMTSMVKRYIDQPKKFQSHNTYWQEAKYLYQYRPILVMSGRDFYDHINQPRFATYFNSHPHLIIGDLAQLDDEIQLRHSMTFSFSQLLIKLRQALERMKYEQVTEIYMNIYKALQICVQHLQQLVTDIQLILQERGEGNSVNHEWVSCLVDSEEPLFYGFDSQFDQLNHQLQEADNLLIKLHIQQPNEFIFDDSSISEWIKQLNNIKNIGVYRTNRILSARKIEGQYYQIQLLIQPENIQFDLLKLSSVFETVTCWGKVGFNEHVSNYKRLNQFQRLDLNFEIEPIKLKLPLQMESNHIARFIQNRSQFDSKHLLVICNSKQALMDSYQQLIETVTLVEQYHILAAGIMGSFKRMMRKAKESDSCIVLVTKQQLLIDDWQTYLDFNYVIIQALPFLSLDHTSVVATSWHLQLEKDAVFNQVVLPQMIDELDYLCSYLAQANQQAEIYLLDTRVFDKYYSHIIRDQLKPRILFERE